MAEGVREKYISPEEEKKIEDGKNPGLGIIELHEQGIDGSGVNVAIIDQKLLLGHREYKNSLAGYSEYGEAKYEQTSMHGPAVASLLVGKSCGVAPEAKLTYMAVPSGERNFKWYVRALTDIIDANKVAKPSGKIRIVSCSIGYDTENPEPSLDQWIQTKKDAERAGIIVVDTSDDFKFDFLGGGSLDKNNIDGYDFALFLKERNTSDWKPHGIIVPSDYRTMAGRNGENEYMYEEKGGASWSVPYLAGIFALALQVNPELTQEELFRVATETAQTNSKGLKIINPKGIIEKIKKNEQNKKYNSEGN